uniref:Uncharacterized protein n=1 Tax=Anguilla anguilla TaxID=7936 RepID=A0A0E9QG16_ANGAN
MHHMRKKQTLAQLRQCVIKLVVFAVILISLKGFQSKNAFDYVYFLHCSSVKLYEPRLCK